MLRALLPKMVNAPIQLGCCTCTTVQGILTLQAVPTPVGDGWRILIEWVSGRIQYISGFETIQDAESWIEKNARTWILKARDRL